MHIALLYIFVTNGEKKRCMVLGKNNVLLYGDDLELHSVHEGCRLVVNMQTNITK